MNNSQQLHVEATRNQRWSLKGTTALVTGGSRGIGHEIVEELASFEAKVFTCARTSKDLDECLHKWRNCGFEVNGISCDITSPTEREKLMESVGLHFNGKLNILVNCVGTTRVKEATEYTSEDYSTIMGTNFEASYCLSQLAYPLLKASGVGSVVFLSSVAAITTVPRTSMYAASKGAINQVAKNLACEWAKDNIRVNAVAPGPIRTSLQKSVM
ncbi:hypothetical protein Leryth_001163, partial [Lithospermum erythrorhizon]